MIPRAPGRQRLVRRAQPRRRAHDPDRAELSSTEHAPKHEGLSRRDRPAGRAAPPPRGPDRRRGLLARRAIGRHPRRTRRSIDGGAGGRGLGLGERPAAMAGGAALRAPEPVLPPRRPPPRRALRRRGVAGLRPRRRPRGPPLARPTTPSRLTTGSTTARSRFSPDGRSVLTWGMGNDARVWEADTGRLRYPPLRHRDKCHDLQFSPDGRLMALASYDGSVRVRDFATGTVVVELPAHPDRVYSASFQPRRAAARDGLPRSHGPGLGLAGRPAGLPAVRARQGRRRRDLHAGRALGALGERRWDRPRLGLADRQAGHAAADDRRPNLRASP